MTFSIVELIVYAALYLAVGAVFGNALACQAAEGAFLTPSRLGKLLAFSAGLVLWPVVLMIGTVMLVRAVTDHGPP